MAQYQINHETNKLIITPVNEDDFSDLMQLPSRRWLKRAHRFEVPATRANCAHLLASGQIMQIQKVPEVLAWIQERASTKTGNRPFPRWYNFKENPFPDQHNAAIKCYKNNAWALFMRMGSGKTKVAIDMATAAFYERLIDCVVVICPNAVKPVWINNELDKHSPCPTIKIGVDSSFDGSKITLNQTQLTWLVCGVESLSQGKTFERLLPFIASHKVAVIVDESTTIANYNSIRTQRVWEFGQHAALKGIMTGTPITRVLTNIFSQFEFLGPEIIGAGDYYAFRNRYCIMGGFKNKKVVGYNHIDELMQLIEPYVYICDKPKGLPEKLFTKRVVTLSGEQKDMYRKLRRAEIPEVSVANVLNRVSKLQEIVGGYLREDPTRTINPLTGREKVTQGKIIWELPDAKNPKILELHNMLEESGDEPMIVWCKGRWELQRVALALSQHGVVGVLHGDVPSAERGPLIQQFQGGDVQFIAATQTVGGIGHTMTAAHLMTYYSNTHSLVDRLQSEDRIHRIGQEDNCLYTDLIAENTVDEPIQESIAAKKNLDEYVRDKLKEVSSTFNELLGGEG